MDQENIYGVFEFEGKEYPFALENQILTIPQIPFQYSKDFAEIEHIETIQGVTYSNRDIVFLGCEVLGHSRVPFATDIKMSILGYIILTSSRNTFDRVDFYSEAINGFYSPRNAYDIDFSDDRTGIVGIKVRNRELYKRDFQCQVNGETFRLGLNVSLSLNLAWEKEQLGTAKSIMSMAFADKKKPNDILGYYLYIRDFLEFVNFQKNIPLDRIELFEKSETGKYERRGKAVIFQADGSEYVPNILKSITFIDVTSECFPTLFSHIAEKRLSNSYNPFFCPESRREDRVVDASKWLNTAICFEGEFNTFFPEYRATQDPLFHDAKQRLLDTIDNAVQISGKSINNKQNNALKSFKSLIEHADTTIKQKFEVCETIYEYEMHETIHKICSLCGVPEDTDLAGVYAAYRNQTAHGVIRRLENCDVATYRILRGFIYVMNLKRANIPADRIKEIVGRMF
jgi:hypothetical protein